MHPILAQLGAITVYTYGVLVATGVILGLWYARRQAVRAALPPRQIWNLGVYVIFGALIVSKLWLICSDWKYFAANPSDIFSLTMFQSAGTFYGGLLGAILTIFLYTRFQTLPLLPVLDISAAALPLSHAIGRLGCFAAGCCFGKPTGLAWGVTFTDEKAARLAGTPLHTALHPTQLYEAAAEFLNFLLLVWLSARQRFAGQILGTYFILYGIERGIIEFFRGDPGRTMMFHDTVSLMQIVSAGLVLAGVLLWWRGMHARKSPSSISTETPFNCGDKVKISDKVLLKRRRMALPVQCCARGTVPSIGPAR
jgi:phosphatidylglycerol:prolipoprotein diacylglycerol transferase